MIRSVAAAAASAVDGMAGFCVRKNGGETKLLRGNKRTDKAIRIDAAHGRLNVTISIVAARGADVADVCRTVVRSVRRDVERQTGFRVGRVCVKAEGIVNPTDSQ